MLILTRTLKEKVIIGDDIIVTVLKINGRFVTLGFEAPKNIKIIRAELRKKDPDDT